jgi:hypothetical protein
MDAELELQHRSEVADARLGVAEDLGWAIAAFGGIAAYLKWDSWLLSIAIAIAFYILAIFKYRKDAAKAEDAYYRVAKLGKYACGVPDDAA